MNKSFQQLMLGTLIKDESQTIELLKNIKKLGYDEIELNSFMIHPTPFLVKALTKFAGMPSGNGGKLDWHKIIKESGLKVTSLHSDLGTLEKETDKVISEAKSFNTKYIVITGMYRTKYDDINELNSIVDRMNKVGKIIKDNGLQLLYHNHNVEFKRLNNNQFVYEYLIENLKDVDFEFDSYWPSEMGVNIFKIIDKLGSRMKLHHINDRGSKLKGPFMTPILKSDAMELGTGAMDLETLIEKDKEYGVETIVVETHKNFIDKSPLKSLEVSIKYLNEHLN